MSNSIAIASNIQDLTGVGEEWLVDPITLVPKIKFFDGKIVGDLPRAINAEDDTLEII